MTPLFACVPVCFLFPSLGVIGVLMYLAGAGRGEPPPPAGVPGPRPPYWVAPAVLLVALVALLLVSLVTAG